MRVECEGLHTAFEVPTYIVSRTCTWEEIIHFHLFRGDLIENLSRAGYMRYIHTTQGKRRERGIKETNERINSLFLVPFSFFASNLLKLCVTHVHHTLPVHIFRQRPPRIWIRIHLNTWKEEI
jgi:hypothetical protein